jgi:hypothetical protein
MGASVKFLRAGRSTLIVAAIAAALLLAIVLVLEKGLRSVVPVAGLSRTTSMELVTVTLKNESYGPRKTDWPKLRIPQAYLTDPADRSGGERERVKIETGMPDLLPRPALPYPTAPAGTTERLAQERYRADGMVVNVGPAREGVRNLNGALPYFFGASAERGGYVLREPLYGLRRVYEVPCMRADQKDKPAANCDVDKPMSEHFFAFNEAGDLIAEFSCNPPWTGPGGGCQTTFLHRGMQILLIFRRQELERWNEFVSAAKSLVGRFLVHSGKS